MKSGILLSLSEVRKYYPVLGGIFKREIGRINALNGVELSVEKGKTTGLIGESGCGKSTLAKLVIKLEEPSSGNLLFAGKPLIHIKGKEKIDFYRKVQMIFQDPFSSLNPRLKVKDIIGEMVRIQGIPKQEEKNKVSEMLFKVGLGAEDLNKFPHQFSGGQRQRIAIARALIVKPSFLIADEPVSALDLSQQTKTLLLLEKLKQQFNLTILLISHDLKAVADFCDKAAVMYMGRIVEIVAGQNLMSDSLHPYSQGLINSIPITDPLQRERKKKLVAGEVPSPLNLPSGCAFRLRCDQRLERCKTEIPELKTISESQQVACHLY